MPSQKKPSKKNKTADELIDPKLISEAIRADEDDKRHRLENPLRFGVVQGEPERYLGERIQRARQAAGLTQPQLSKRMAHADKEGRGVSAAVISLYERGVNKPGPRELRLLCETLRVTPNILLYGDEDPFRGRTELARYGGIAKAEAEFLAYLTYCFSRLHHHHREAMMQLMLGLLRGWNNNFDDEMHANAVEAFRNAVRELERLLKDRARHKRSGRPAAE